MINGYAYCSSLQQVLLPNTLTTLNGSVFSHCTNLNRIQIPSSVTTIQSYAFYGCDSLLEVVSLNPSVPYVVQQEVFTNYDATVYVKKSALEKYKTVSVWKNFKHFASLEDYVSGDVNADGEVNVGDVTALINTILDSDAYPCDAACDINTDDDVNVSDASALIAKLLAE